jgi:hypothetical protein
MDAGLPVGIAHARAITNQAARKSVFAKMVHGRQTILCRERNDPIASRIEVWVGCHEQRTDLLLEEKSEGSVQSRVVAGFCYEKATTN